MFKELRQSALLCLAERSIVSKTQSVAKLIALWRADEIALDTSSVLELNVAIPGKPETPILVSPQSVKRRALNTAEGRAILIHALAHIEFNAINLALDAIWRFPNLPEQFYADWLQVADEEVQHFILLSEHLRRLGYQYGDFPAHNGLWDMADKTREDVLARIALVPRTLEARGLDVVPSMRYKLAQAGDLAAAEILDIILRDEIGHVRIGNHWYFWLCEQRGLEPLSTYRQLANQHHAALARLPFNVEARLAAGFSQHELAQLAES